MIEIEKNYDHKKVEEGKEQFWLDNHYFEAMREENLSKPPFSMIVPPPNVTGILHIGHAINTTIIDIIARYKKLSGYDVLFLPAMDHAGIATQAKVEEKLRQEGVNKYELGREKFLEETYKWKDEHADYITKQWLALGLSMDYSKSRFTLDDGMQKAVAHVFKTLYDEGLIYRGERIINWDPELKTALSDIEVVYKEDKGEFYYFKYWLEDHSTYLEVATTRPETMFGDQAVCFNPEDERYKDLEGKRVINPANGELLPLIADRYVDKEFGTGVMKCTPAHDPNDFKIAKRHNLKLVRILNDDGTMNEKCGEFNGLDRYICRDKLVEKIKSEGNLLKIEDITHNVAHSERSHSVVEPLLSKQWFVSMRKLADAVIEIQNSEDKTSFFPTRFADTFLTWLKNTDDWCISRQLWWGHRIPVYTDKITGEVVCSETPLDPEKYSQDEDVLDTWFSSALAPFAFLGWPEKTELLERYYPLDVMVTAYDIIFFWVERMAFEGVHFTKKMPFKKVYIHGLVRDEKGRKMSKSLNNGIDPFKVIEEYGTDSLRYALATNSTPGLDVNFSMKKVENAHIFLNKIWNASRYVLNLFPEDYVPFEIDFSSLSPLDSWILNERDKLIENVKANMEKYELGQAANYIYNFIYDIFCSNYLEFSKVTLNSDDENRKKETINVLYHCLKDILTILFPFCPFLSEEIYSYLPFHKKSLYEESYPLPYDVEYKKEDLNFAESLVESIKFIRNHKSILSLAPNYPLNLALYTDEKTYKEVYPYLKRFSFAKEITLLLEKKGNMVHYLSYDLSVEDDEKAKQAIAKRIEFLKDAIAHSEKLLNNPNFLAKAKKEKVDYEKEQYEKYTAELKSYL